MLVVDACLYAGLRIADGRPQDLGMDVSPEDLAAAVRAALARPDVHALVVVYVPIVATTGLPHAAALRAAISEATVPVLTTFLAAEGLVRSWSSRPPTAAPLAGRCRPSGPRSVRWPRWPTRCGTARG